MRVLVLGGSAIVRKRVLPALAARPEVTGVEIASRTASDAAFPDYATALEESAAELVYVSLVNSDHAPWAERALESGRHVVVDKPAFPDLAQAERLVELSRSRGLCLAEATVYTRHPQIEAIRELFTEAADAPSRIVASFSFPPLDEGNFRYRRELGGGALADLGPYAVSPGRLFFAARPEEVECRVLSRGGPDDLETAFSVLMRYREGRSLVGHFGFDTAYRNRLSLLGSELSVDVDRIFTTPETLENGLEVRRRSGASRVKAPAADCFALFLHEVVRRIGEHDLEGLRQELVDDAFALEQLRRSAGGR